MTRDQNAQPAVIPAAISLPADLLESNWRVVRRDGQGNAEGTLYSFPQEKSQSEVREWATRKFAGCEICAVFPRGFKSREWAVLRSYRQGLSVQVDRLTLDHSADEDFASLKAREAFPKDHNFTLYPV